MRFLILLATMSILLHQSLPAQQIASPEHTFGFRMGSDRQLIDWEQIVSYFRMLDAASGRLKLVELGRTTLDRPMIMAIISSEANMDSLEDHRRIQEALARPFSLDESRAGELINRGRSVCLITMNIHSSEIAASQGSVELAHELVTAETAEIREIRENVIVLMVPSLNPDGQDMITKWYRETVTTPYEGSRMPYKYHHYADHDNNRDWFFFNLAESRHMARVLYREWYPEIVMDQHQMGSRGARYFLPPYADPVNPNVPPSLTANTNMVGKHIIADMQEQGFKGLVTGTIFNAYFEGTMSKTPLWHNRIGILTEAASVRYATPMYFPRTSLRGMGIDLPEYKQQTNFVDPWPGGWWRLRDIVEYQKAAAISLLRLSAAYRQRFKDHFYTLNRRAIDVSREDHPQAFVFPGKQHDLGNMLELLRRLEIAGVDIYQAARDFSTAEGSFRAGDYIVPLSQPARAYIKDLLEVQRYPDLREFPGGPPRQPYDVTAWTLPLQMGVHAVAVFEPPVTPMMPARLEIPAAAVFPAGGWVAVERRHTRAYELANRVAGGSATVLVLKERFDRLEPGTLVFKAEDLSAGMYQALLQKHGISVVALDSEFDRQRARVTEPLKRRRIGIYQPWISWIYDEGWLRLVLDEFGFGYEVLHNDDIIKEANLNRDFDLIIFGSQDRESIVEGIDESEDETMMGEPEIRKEYRGGISPIGVERIKKFMLEGGTVLFLGEAAMLAVEDLNLPVSNSVGDLPREEFFIPGSLLNLQLDMGSELTRGMQRQTPIYYNRPVAFRLHPYTREIRESGFFADHDLLLSGWAVGDEHLHDLAALVEIPAGKGRAVLYGFRPQHRGQTFATFKLIFNALIN